MKTYFGLSPQISLFVKLGSVKIGGTEAFDSYCLIFAILNIYRSKPYVI